MEKQPNTTPDSETILPVDDRGELIPNLTALVWIQFCSRFHSRFLSGIFQRIISYFHDEIPTLPPPPHGQENHPPKTHPFTSSSLSAYQTLTTSSKVASYCSLTAHQPPGRQRFGWKIRHVDNVWIGFILKFHIGLTLFTLTFQY